MYVQYESALFNYHSKFALKLANCYFSWDKSHNKANSRSTQQMQLKLCNCHVYVAHVHGAQYTYTHEYSIVMHT